MEEEKAAAYYDDITRKGEGAARFKQGLGFSSGGANESFVPARGSALASSSSYLSSFVKASSPAQNAKFEKQAQLESIQNKLKKKPNDQTSSPPPRVSERSRHRSRSREKDRDRYSDRERHRRRRSRSRSRSGERRKDRDKERRRSRSPSRSRSRERRKDRDKERRRSRSPSRSRSRSRERPRYREKERRRSRSRSRGRRSERRTRSRSLSPRERRRSEKGSNGVAGKEGGRKEKNNGVDYSQLIQGYDKMTPAERVKARMKRELADTVEKDEGKGMHSGWERFQFDKDAPLDDEEIEVAEDDATLVKHIGQSFRFSAVEAKREEQIKAAHDEAMFGAPSLPAPIPKDTEPEADDSRNESNENGITTSLLSEKVAGWRGDKSMVALSKKMGSCIDKPIRFGHRNLRRQARFVQMASSTASKWLRPEVYPLFAAVGFAVGICGLQLYRNLRINPEVRVNKQNRAAGVLENHGEGEKYSEHGVRKFVRNRAPEIMPSLNRFFTDPK